MNVNNLQETYLSAKSYYQPEIDGLRAFAVFAVILNHFNKNFLPNGYLGVDIFFVISGFVITSSLYRRPSKNFKDFISGFYKRRFKRLIPALSVFVLIMSIAICLFNPQPIFSLRTAIASLFGVSNLYLLKQSTDYFAQSTELNVFAHTWSLGVEEQFYILFPFLIWFSGFSRKTKNSSRYLFLTLGLLFVASLICFLYLYPINKSAAYFLMPSRFWEIATGCLIFIRFKKITLVKQYLDKIPRLVLLFLIIGVMYLPISMARLSTIAVVALSAVLIISSKRQTKKCTFLNNPKIVYMGVISYSLYLWHWGVLSLSRWTIGIHWWSVPFQFLLIIGRAITSYQYFEKPIRKSTWLEEGLKMLGAGIGIFTLSGSLIALEGPLKGILYTGKKNINTQKNWRNEITLGNSSLTGKKCNADESYSPKQLELLFSECKYPFFRESSNQPTLAFMGDSHTLSLLKAEEILSKSGFRIIHHSFSECPFPAPPYGIYPIDCDNFLRNAENKIFQDLKSGDSIIIHNYHLMYLGGKNLKELKNRIFNKYKYIVSDSSTKIDLYIKGLTRLSKKASKNSIKIYLIGSPYRNPGLIFRKEWFRPFVDEQKTLLDETINAKELNKTLLKKIKDSSLTNVIFINPLDILDDTCGKDTDSYLVCFRDQDHMSNKSSKKILDFILKNHLRS